METMTKPPRKSGKSTPHGIYVSEAIWERAERRASLEGVSMNYALAELLEGYALGKIRRIPGQSEGKGTPRNSTHSQRVTDKLWNAVRRMAHAEGVGTNRVMVDLLDAYGRGKLNLPTIVKTY